MITLGPVPEGADVFYRYEDRPYANAADEYGDPVPRQPGTNMYVRLYKHPVLKRTKCGAWIEDVGGKRFINLSWTKRFACPTLEEAQESYRKRKARQIRIHNARVKDAEEALRVFERQLKGLAGSHRLGSPTLP